MCNTTGVLCVCVSVCILPCAAVKEDEPQLTDRGAEKVEHPLPSPPIPPSSAPSPSISRPRRMPVRHHHASTSTASLSTQAIRMNEAEKRY